VEEGLLVLPLAMLAAGGFAALTGAVAMRTEGVYFIMITLAFGQMAFHFGGALSDYGGDDGLTLWSRPSLGGLPLLDGRRPLYFWALGAAALTFLGLRALGASAFGRLIDGARQNPARMRALGVDAARWRLRAYALAGALGGLAGALLAIHAEFVSPAYMHWTRSGELIVMVVLGGVASLGGAGLAAVGLIAAEEALSGLSEHWRILLGLIVLTVALFAPRGVGGLMRGRR
jgi:branched-chain amino acid transport system permease protein